MSEYREQYRENRSKIEFIKSVYGLTHDEAQMALSIPKISTYSSALTLGADLSDDTLSRMALLYAIGEKLHPFVRRLEVFEDYGSGLSMLDVLIMDPLDEAMILEFNDVAKKEAMDNLLAPEEESEL